MKLNLETDLLQTKIPSNSWLVKDTNKKIIRTVSTDVTNVESLTNQEKLCMQQLIDFVRYSQDPDLNKKTNKDYLRPAVGLAAPQIGVNKNLFFARWEWKNEDKEPEEMAAVNPKIISRSSQIVALEDGEGCLSVDEDHHGIVPRSYKIIVEYYDFLKEKNVKETLKGYKAIVFQHEYDHNQGHLYYDLINKKDPEFVGKDWILI